MNQIKPNWILLFSDAYPNGAIMQYAVYMKVVSTMTRGDRECHQAIEVHEAMLSALDAVLVSEQEIKSLKRA
jgi:hypothetical protein